MVHSQLRDRLAVMGAMLVDGPRDVAAASLHPFAGKVDTARHGEPLALGVVTGEWIAYRRSDGIVVIPITALGP